MDDLSFTFLSTPIDLQTKGTGSPGYRPPEPTFVVLVSATGLRTEQVQGTQGLAETVERIALQLGVTVEEAITQDLIKVVAGSLARLEISKPKIEVFDAGSSQASQG